MKWFWYYFGLTTSYLFNLCFLRTKVFYEDENRRNRRIRGKAIIISNHQNPLDGLVIAHKFFSRRINYIAADFFKGAKRALVPFIRVSGAVIVDRESYDFSFFEESKRLLNRNKLVLVFPEGRMTFDYEPTRFIYSYVALSIQSGAKIVPVVSDCNYRSFGRVHIIVGNSIEPSQYIQSGNLTKEKLKEANESIYQQFIRLYYQLKKKKYDRFKSKYIAISPKPGDIIRIFVGTHYHYGVYLSGGEVV
ncbi:MAG: 1-acyl-sn-glycerol-3-phosphate acyltransferase, partial [Oscillospiraceae bacterium]|nr:1-acyl-sn-glycerol-3-phosphate acyltransferase [Oscillospiraceae bacterium]